MILLKLLGRFFDRCGWHRAATVVYRPVFRQQNRKAQRDEVKAAIAREIELSKTPSAFIGRRNRTGSPLHREDR